MIADRYLIREIVKPLAVVLVVLTVIVTSYDAGRFLSNAVNGLLPIDMIVQSVGLITLVSLETLIPIALYLAVVLAFGRLYSDSEFVAMFALGLSPARAMGSVAALSLCVAAVVAAVSLLAGPWAHQQSHELSNRAAASLDTQEMKAGTFYVSADGDRTVFIERRAGQAAPGRDVFVQLRHRDANRVIYARSVEQRPGPGGDGPVMHFTDAHVYDIRDGGDGSDLVMNAKDLFLDLPPPQIALPEYSSLAASTGQLASSHSAADVAELEWRLSTFVSTLLLGMLAVPLSRSRPRAHKSAKIGIAILIYAGYYLLCDSLRTWVRNGVIAPLPGLWWGPLSLAAVLCAFLLGPRLAWRFRRA
jgi:lipopolysaccharide export system permease protein